MSDVFELFLGGRKREEKSLTQQLKTSHLDWSNIKISGVLLTFETGKIGRSGNRK